MKRKVSLSIGGLQLSYGDERALEIAAKVGADGVDFGTYGSRWDYKRPDSPFALSDEDLTAHMASLRQKAADLGLEIYQTHGRLKGFCGRAEEDTDILELDGFVHFRLYEYVAELSDVVAEAVERLIAAKEYDEFIGLLKYFIDLQPHHEHLVHILPAEGGAFELSDSVNFSDFLISCLITLAPERIVIHKGDAIKNQELLRTISAVFGQKVSFCHSCPLCKL